jgi:hypothetical protein
VSASRRSVCAATSLPLGCDEGATCASARPDQMRLGLFCGDVVDEKPGAVVRAELELVGSPPMEALGKEALEIYAVRSGIHARVGRSTVLDSSEESNDSPEPKLLLRVERLPCPEHRHRPIVSFEAQQHAPQLKPPAPKGWSI